MNHPWKYAPGRLGPPSRGVLVAGLIAIASGCQVDTPSEDSPSSTPPAVQTQSLVSFPRTCEDIKNTQSLAKDGEFILYVDSDRMKPWKAYCHDMAGTPSEYLTLPESSQFSNFSEYAAGGWSPGTTVRTLYRKIRINPITLRVRAWDKTFTTSTGQLQHSGNGPTVTVMPYATAMSCDGGDTGRATVDLRGTPFYLLTSSFQHDGYIPSGSATYEANGQVSILTGGGSCGWTAPTPTTTGEDPLEGGVLSLYYRAPAPEWKTAAHVYPVGGTLLQGQSLDLGWYDMNQLTMGNDAINAVHVPRGWKVVLYEDAGFKGTQHIFTADADLTGHIVNLKTSSIHVEASVVVYTEPGFKGTALSLRPGRYTLEQLGLGGKTLRSLKVPEGFRVTLHGWSNFFGVTDSFTQDVDLTGHPLDAKVASLFIESPTQREGNVIYGQWQSSGGRSASNPGNRKVLAEFMHRDDIVTFELESTAGPVLYLLDGSDQVVAESTPVGGNVARLTASLTGSGGNHVLVAATMEPGKSGDFTLRSDRARLRYLKRIEVKTVTLFEPVWDDGGTGAKANLSVWRPDIDSASGYYSLGDIGMPSHGVAPRSAFVVKADRGILRPPDGYTLLWDSHGTRGRAGSLWQPIAPQGFTCLGIVASDGFFMPSTDLIRCVPSEYAVQVAPTWVWDDTGSGANASVTLYEAPADSPRALYTSSLVGQIGYNGPPGNRIWALNKSALDTPELAGGFVDDYAVLQLAPQVWLHHAEQFLPSTTDYFLANVRLEGNNLTTNQPLGCDDCTSPPFLKGLNPYQTHVPVYAQVIQRTVNGAPTNITDVIYWTFYNYNLGKRVCIGVYVGDTCYGYEGFGLGFYNLGNHVGDWEHLTLRFIDGRPLAATMSQHGKAPVFGYGGKLLPMMGFHPEAYSALGSHGLYPDAAVHEYLDLHNGDSLKDITDRGISWKTWNGPVIFPWQPQGTYTGSLDWLNITAGWGNAKSGCDNLISWASGECILNGGPGGPMQKDFSDPSYSELE